MQLACAAYIGCLILLSASSPAAAPKPNPKIIVSIANHAHLPGLALSQATKAAALVFRQVGIETVLLDCTPNGAKPPANPACPLQLSPTVLFVRIVPRSRTEGFGLHYSKFGIAAPSPNGGFGSHAYVFAHRVEELARRQGAEAPVILGHMIAHEIGHLLLGPGSHSQSSIMAEDWGREEVELAGRGRLQFTARQGKRLREQVQARMKADQAGPKSCEQPELRKPGDTTSGPE